MGRDDRRNAPLSPNRHRHNVNAPNQRIPSGYVDPLANERAAVAPRAVSTTPRQPSNSEFLKLGLSAATVDLLDERGITIPTPIQELTMADALAGRDLCGKARTGSGKTFAFGLPMVERITRGKPGLPSGLVLVPTRELATQVARALSDFAAARRLRIITVFGGTPLGGQVRNIRQGADIVVATPGRLNDLIERGVVSMSEIQVAVVDEADQMADFGFMPQVERILDGLGKERQVLLFSATLDGEIARLTKKYQTDAVAYEAPVDEGEETTVSHRFIGVDPAEKLGVTASIAAGPDRTILFVRTQRAAERLSINLAREGVNNGTLHGGLSQNRRERALADFASGRVPVLVATNIAARGIHVDDIGIVVHHDPPEDLKTFVHRSGRTARAGATGVVVTLVEPSQQRDIFMLKRQAGIKESVVSMNPTDPRLGDLAGWTPPEDVEQAPAPRGPVSNNNGYNANRRRTFSRPVSNSGPRDGAQRTWQRR